MEKKYNSQKIYLEELNDYLVSKIWGSIDSFGKTYDKLIEWVDKHKKIPLENSKNIKENLLGTWCKARRNDYENRKLYKGTILLLEHIVFWCWNSDELLMDNDIVRSSPRIFQMKRLPRFYPTETIDFFRKLQNKQEIEIMKEYFDWKNGINPKTGRKIKINGRTHKKLREKYVNIMMYFKDNIDNVDLDEYEKNIEKIKRKIDKINSVINDHNIRIYNLRKKIGKLNNWNDYIIFDGVKYGTCKKIIDCIHIEKNCNGTMEFVREETEYHFNDRPFYHLSNHYHGDREIKYKYYICNKCGYQVKK